MDLSTQDAMRAHYNSHANQHSNAQEAHEARCSGGAIQLKSFHNSIKRALIQRYAAGTEALLDLACGRGGDLRKWSDAQIKYVKGIDLSPGEIAEAQKRYSELQRDGKASKLRAEFEVSSSLGIEEWRDPSGRLYDNVTCMFALHYFFASEAALKQMLHNVSINLKPGGYFFGTIPDGKRVLAALNRQTKLTSPMLDLAAGTFCDAAGCVRVDRKGPCAEHGQPPPAVFGSAYTCAIGDTVTAGRGDSQGSLEYLMFANVLQGVAQSFGLQPVIHINSGPPSLSQYFDSEDEEKLFKHFKPRFVNVDKSLSDASSLFCAFVFRKPPVPSPTDATGLQSSPPMPQQQQRKQDQTNQTPEDMGTGKRKRDAQEQPNSQSEAAVDTSKRKRDPRAPSLKRAKVRRKGGATVSDAPTDS